MFLPLGLMGGPTYPGLCHSLWFLALKMKCEDMTVIADMFDVKFLKVIQKVTLKTKNQIEMKLVEFEKNLIGKTLILAVFVT